MIVWDGEVPSDPPHVVTNPKAPVKAEIVLVPSKPKKQMVDVDVSDEETEEAELMVLLMEEPETVEVKVGAE